VKSGSTGALGLVGDIGGTNSRFALVARGETALSAPLSLPNADFTDMYGALDRYLHEEAKGKKPEWAVIAVAGPVRNGAVSLTNRAWKIDSAEISKRFGIADARLVNDFSALAAAAPYVASKDRMALGGGATRTVDGVTTIAVVGPGTGLGVGGLVRAGGRDVVLTTEGGHSSFAPIDALEREIERLLQTRFERVSNERLLCGEGLINIYWALGGIHHKKTETLTPREITRRAAEKSDPLCIEAVDIFSRVLGAFAGDVVLTMGAQGGCYIAGGMVPAIIDIFDRDAFRERFEAKGRFRRYMQETPAWIINAPFTALLGSAALAAHAHS
jgi:glucokinase